MDIKKNIAAFLVCTSVLLAVTPAQVQQGFLLSQNGDVDGAKELLHQSVVNQTPEEIFLTEQFVAWSAKHFCEMKESFDESAFYIVAGEKELAKNAILNYFEDKNSGVEEFTDGFVNWGLGVMKITSVIEDKG